MYWRQRTQKDLSAPVRRTHQGTSQPRFCPLLHPTAYTLTPSSDWHEVKRATCQLHKQTMPLVENQQRGTSYTNSQPHLGNMLGKCNNKLSSNANSWTSSRMETKLTRSFPVMCHRETHYRGPPQPPPTSGSATNVISGHHRPHWNLWFWRILFKCGCLHKSISIHVCDKMASSHEPNG